MRVELDDALNKGETILAEGTGEVDIVLKNGERLSVKREDKVNATGRKDVYVSESLRDEYKQPRDIMLAIMKHASWRGQLVTKILEV